ncbi:MAG: CapA family protein [Bacilli bacterium]|nr:CapA family protein [Bacilli bacterium]
MKYKKTTYISILLFFIGIIFLYYGLSISFALDYTESNLNEMNQREELEEEQSIDTIVEEKKVNIKLSFIGDSLIGSFKGENYIGNFRDLLEKNEYSFPYKNVSSIFMNDDFTIANGENVFTDKELIEMEKNHSPAYWYYAPTRFANIYKESSIEVVSIMNNHTYDYGADGLNDTINALKNSNVIVGSEDAIILEKDEVKIAVICINLFSSFQYEECVSNINKIKNDVNYVIVYFHGGTEYLHFPTDSIVKYSRGFIDNGADLVIGAHPHVLEPIEVYKNKTIVYSLGSFLFGGTKHLENRTIIYQKELEFNLDENNLTESENIIPCYLYTALDGYESWIPSVIENENEKNKVLDFMHGLEDSPL